MEQISRSSKFRLRYFFTCMILINSVLFEAKANSNDEIKTYPVTFQDKFEHYLNTTIAPKTPGYAIVVVIEGEILLIKGEGTSDFRIDKPINLDTLFRLASVSKTFASTAAGRLVEEDKLNWNTSASSLLNKPLFSREDYNQTVSLAHLLSHTSGLIPHAYTNLLESKATFSEITDKLKKVDFICPPGKCYGYQNIVYSLAGAMIEVASALSYETYVSQAIFQPLAMKSASFGLKAFLDHENKAIPHRWDKVQQVWQPVSVNDDYYKVAPAAGINASIKDMSQWLLAQLGHRQNVLSDTLLNQLHSPRITTSSKQAHQGKKYQGQAKNIGYGLGWRTFDYGKYKHFIHHGGWVNGARTEMVFNRELNMGMVYLSNSESKFASEIVPTFLDIFIESQNKDLDISSMVYATSEKEQI